MKLTEVMQLTNAQIICGEERIEDEINHGFASNKVEDVLDKKCEGVLLITQVSHP